MSHWRVFDVNRVAWVVRCRVPDANLIETCYNTNGVWLSLGDPYYFSPKGFVSTTDMAAMLPHERVPLSQQIEAMLKVVSKHV